MLQEQRIHPEFWQAPKSKDMEGARGGRWANRKYTSNAKCKVRSGLITCAHEVCAGRCDVTNTDRSPQTLPRSQKPLRSLTRAHALARRDHFQHDREQMNNLLGYHDTVEELGSLVPRSTARSQGLNRAVMQVQQSAPPLRTVAREQVVLKHA